MWTQYGKWLSHMIITLLYSHIFTSIGNFSPSTVCSDPGPPSLPQCRCSWTALYSAAMFPPLILILEGKSSWTGKRLLHLKECQHFAASSGLSTVGIVHLVTISQSLCQADLTSFIVIFLTNLSQLKPQLWQRRTTVTRVYEATMKSFFIANEVKRSETFI